LIKNKYENIILAKEVVDYGAPVILGKAYKTLICIYSVFATLAFYYYYYPWALGPKQG
jgi:hypothetical protein